MNCRKLAPPSVGLEQRPPKLGPLPRINSPLQSPALTPLREFLSALRGWCQAFGYMKKQGLRAYHLAGPAALAGIALAGFKLTRALTEWIRSAVLDGLKYMGAEPSQLTTGPTGWWSDILSWGANGLESLLEWGVALLVLWLKVKVTKYLLLTLMAPFMSALAGAVRKRETGTAIPFKATQILADLARGVRTALVLFTLETGLTLCLAATGLFLTLFAAPVAVLLSPVLLVIGWMVGAYFYGAAVFDAVYEQAGLDWRASLRAGWSTRYRLLGIGAVFSALLALPAIGVLIAALLGPMPCTVAAARLTHSPSP